MRLIVGWTGVALFYGGGILAVLVATWFFGRMARRDVRVAQRVAQVQGLLVLALAISVFGSGLAVASLDSAPLVPLGLGFIGLSLAIGTYGARLSRK